MSPEILTLMIMKSNMPDGGKTLLVRLLERDRNFQIVLAVYSHHLNGHALTDEPGSAFELTANEFHLSPGHIRRIYTQNKAIIQNLV